MTRPSRFVRARFQAMDRSWVGYVHIYMGVAQHALTRSDLIPDGWIIFTGKGRRVGNLATCEEAKAWALKDGSRCDPLPEGSWRPYRGT